jgi:hypothetical protein
MVAYTFAHAITFLLLFLPCRGTDMLTVKGETIHIELRSHTLPVRQFGYLYGPRRRTHDRHQVGL